MSRPVTLRLGATSELHLEWFHGMSDVIQFSFVQSDGVTPADVSDSTFYAQMRRESDAAEYWDFTIDDSGAAGGIILATVPSGPSDDGSATPLPHVGRFDLIRKVTVGGALTCPVAGTCELIATVTEVV